MSKGRSRTTRRTLTALWASLALIVSAVVAVPASADPLLNQPPDPPSNVVAVVVTSGVNLSWDAPTNTGTDGSGNPSAVAYYNVYDATQSGAEALDPVCQGVLVTSCEVTNLTPGDTLYYEVTAVNAAGNESATSAEQSVPFSPAPDVSLSIDSTPVLLGPHTLSATLDLPAPGTVDFTINGLSVGCDAVAVDTSQSPALATCQVDIASVGDDVADATFTPSDPSAYSTAVSNELDFTALADPSVLTFDANATATYGQSTTLSAVVNAQGTVTFTADGASIGCDSLPLTNVPPAVTCDWTPTSTGSVTLEADFTSSDPTFANSSSQMVVDVSPAAQSPLAIAPASGAVGHSLTLSATGGSTSGDISFALDPDAQSAPGCSLTGDQLTSTTAGYCYVIATRAGDADYLPVSSPSTGIDFALNASTPLVITATPPTPTDQQTTTLTTTGGGGTEPVTFALDPNDPGTGVCVLKGNQLSVTSFGTCQVIASQASDGTYAASTSASTTITFSPLTQTALSITSTSGVYGTPITLTTSGGSGTGALSFHLDQGPCSLVGATLTALSAGTCDVTATRGADKTYAATSSASTGIVFSPAPQATLVILSTEGSVSTPLTLTTTGGSGTGAVSYQVSGGTATGCQIVAGALSATSAGTCVVVATKAADPDYTAINSLATTVTLLPQGQALLTLPNQSVGFTSTVTLVASGGSGTGALSYAVVGGTALQCTLTGSTLRAASTGTCLVDATRAADATHDAQTSSVAVITFNPIAQAPLVLTTVRSTYGHSLALRTSGGSGTGAITYRVSSQSTTCTLVGATLRAQSAGTCLVTATRAGDEDYFARSSSATVVTFQRAVQSSLTVLASNGVAGRPVTLGARGGSGAGAVSFVAHPGTASGCVIVTAKGTSSLTAQSAGTCVVVALKSGDRDYISASSASLTLTFVHAAQRPIVVVARRAIVGRPVTLSWHGGSGRGAVSVEVVSGTATGCQVRGAVLSSTSVGTCVVRVHKAGDARYDATTSGDATIEFQRLNQAALVATGGRGHVGQPVVVAVSGGSGTGSIRLVVVGGAASCRVIALAVVASRAGTCRVEAIKQGDASYRATHSATATVVFVAVHKKPRRVVHVTVTPISGLRTDQTVAVAGSGFTSGERLVVSECLVGAARSSQCAASQSVTTRASVRGDLSRTLITVVTGTVGDGTCATTRTSLSSCEVRVSSGARTLATRTLSFSPDVLGRDFSVTPSSDLRAGEIVTLRGTGFTPGDKVFFAECLVGALAESRCATSTFKSVKITRSGAFPLTHLTLVTGRVGAGTCGTSARDATACDIAVANTNFGDAAVANITFTP